MKLFILTLSNINSIFNIDNLIIVATNSGLHIYNYNIIDGEINIIIKRSECHHKNK